MNQFPETFEESIISYLKLQQDYLNSNPEDGYLDLKYEEEPPKNPVKEILDELLFKVNKRIVCKDKWENLRVTNNQYPLFDLTDYIPDFCIDEELLKKLSFREILLVSKVNTTMDSEMVKPEAIGGLCLDIHIVEGHPAPTREIPVDAVLEEEVMKTLQKAKAAILKKSMTTEKTELDDDLQRKLQEYEEYLKKETELRVHKFVVHLSSQFDVGVNAGSRITSWVDRNLHTLEERRIEYIKEEGDVINEKSLYVGLQKQKYYLRHHSSLDQFEERKYYGMGKTKELVCEGANFILMRYLAIMQYVGSFELSTVYINGDMCRNIYECTGPTKGEVNGKEIDVCKIYRYIIEECGIEHHCVTVLNLYGRIITQEWEGCDVIINMNPKQFIRNEPPSAYDRLVLSKTWREDMQLMSKFLDCKTDVERKMHTYMADHPEVKDIVADYMNNVLLLKPENVTQFTMEYFQSLYPCKLPRQAFFEDFDYVDFVPMNNDHII